MSRPSLTLAVLSRDGGDRLRRLLTWAVHSEAPIDEILLYIDSRTADDSAEVGRIAGAKVKTIKVIGTIDAALAEVHGAVKTDWGLHLGDDEIMGDRFNEETAAVMLGREDVDGWSLPRYNLCAPGRYIATKPDGEPDPRYPDYAQRLFRRGKIVHSGVIHEGAFINGPVMVGDAHIFHFDMLDQTREERLAKWDRYVAQGVLQASRDRGVRPWYYRQWAVMEDYPYIEKETEEGCMLWPR